MISIRGKAASGMYAKVIGILLGRLTRRVLLN